MSCPEPAPKRRRISSPVEMNMDRHENSDDAGSREMETEVEITGSRSRRRQHHEGSGNLVAVQDLHLPRNYFHTTVRPGERPFHTPVVDLTQEEERDGEEEEDVEFMSSRESRPVFDAAESRLYTARVFQYLFRHSGIANLRSTRVRGDPSVPPRLQPDLRSKVLPPVEPAHDGYVRSWSANEDYRLVCTKCQDELGSCGAARTKEKEEKREEEEQEQEQAPYSGVFAASCSHMYCGKCAKEYRKRPGRGKRAIECAADECHVHLGGKLCMTQVFI